MRRLPALAVLLAPVAAAALPKAAKKAPSVEVVWSDGVEHAWTVLDDLQKRWTGNQNQVDSVAFSPDGTKVLSGGRDDSVKLWDAAGLRLLGTWGRHPNSVRGVAYSLDGTRALSAGEKVLKLWDAASGEELGTWPSPRDWAQVAAFAPDGTRAVSGEYEGGLTTWDVATGRALRSWKAHFAGVIFAAYLPDGRRILTAGVGYEQLALWDAQSGASISTATFVPAVVRSAALSPDGRTALVWTSDPSVLHLWDLEHWRPLDSWPTPGVKIAVVAFSPDGTKAVLGEDNGDLEVRSLPSGNVLAVWRGNGKAVNAVAFSPDGSKVLAAGDDRVLRLRDAADGRLLATGVPARECPDYVSKLHGMEAVAEAAAHAYSCISDGYAGPAPTAAVLEQGKFETREKFETRAAEARAEAARDAQAYRAKLAALPAFIRPETVRYALLRNLCGPKVASTRYDADARTFAARVEGSCNPFFHQDFALVEPVAPEDAPEFDKALAVATSSVTFALDGERLSVSGARFLVAGKPYDALPADGAASLAKATIAAPPSAAPSAAPGLRYSEDPAVAAKQRELAALKKRRAERAQLSALEEEIARLKADGSAPRATAASDVDAPAYHLAPRPDDFALVVGIEKYRSLPAAEYAERDASAVRRHLLAMGVPERNIVTLAGGDATKSRLQAYLEEWLPKNVKPDSTVFVYYSGHGAPDAATAQAYLVPADGDPMFLKTTAYPLADLYAALNKLPARRIVVALDSCFSGAGGRSVIAKGARPLVTKVAASRGLGRVTLLAAASGDQITGALDSQGHGLFTYYLLKGLEREAKTPSAATAAGLFRYLSPLVQDEARRQNREQTPILTGDAPLFSR